MKNCVTVAVLKNCDKLPDEILFEGVEIIKSADDESGERFFARLKKSAQGKYLILTDGKFTLREFYELLTYLDKSNADVVTFSGGTCFKTALLKVAEFCGSDKVCAEIALTFAAKSVAEFAGIPLVHDERPLNFDEADANCVIETVETYAKVCSRLNKEVYNLAFNTLCERVTELFAAAIVAARSGEVSPETLIELNEKIKPHTVLYLAVDKRLDIKGGLKGLAENGFKIPSGVAKALMKRCNSAF